MVVVRVFPKPGRLPVIRTVCHAVLWWSSAGVTLNVILHNPFFLLQHPWRCHGGPCKTQLPSTHSAKNLTL